LILFSVPACVHIRGQKNRIRVSAMTISKALTITARVILGLVFFVYGLNGFLQFLPTPSMPAPAMPFIGGLAASGYFFPLLAMTQTVTGAALLIGRFVPLALAALAPVVLNILAVHLFLAPSGIPHAVGLLVLEAFLLWSYRDAFRPLFRARNEVTVVPRRHSLSLKAAE
jgi:uncharacterized membrane protein YphA (DoxX/SURF4 family)